MRTNGLPFFLGLAREWRAAADILRGYGVPPDSPALFVWREAAWCHVLFASGHHAAAVARLRVVLRDVSGAPPPQPTPCRDEDEALSAAANLFERLHAAVVARHPNAFGRPAAA